MTKSRVVKTGSFTTTYSIVEHDSVGSPVYDWVLETGEDSSMFFDSAEEAEEDVTTRYGV